MNIGKLSKRITVEEIVTTNNAQSWSVVATIWAGVRGPTEEQEIKIRYRSGITDLMYVKYGAEVLAINSIKDPDGKRAEMVLACKEETIEAIELKKATEAKDSTGRLSKTYIKATDLLGVVLPKDADIDQRQQGTIYKRQFEVQLKGDFRHEAMAFGHGMKVQGIDCDIRGVQDHPGKLIVFKLQER